MIQFNLNVNFKVNFKVELNLINCLLLIIKLLIYINY